MATDKKVFKDKEIEQIEVVSSLVGWERQFCELIGSAGRMTYPVYAKVEEGKTRYGWTKTAGENAMVIVMGKVRTPVTNVFDYMQQVEIVMPAYGDSHTIAQTLVYAPKIELVAGNVLNINNVACLLIHFPPLATLIREYAANPDEGVTFVTVNDKGEKTRDPSPGLASPSSQTPLYTRAEMVSMAYFVLLMMIKSIDQRDGNTQHKEFTEARLKSFGYIISGGAQCSLSKITGAVLGAADLSNKISHYPRFKSTVFSLVVMGEGPEAAHAREILKDTAMTPFKMVEDFILAEDITLLHIQPRILSELDAFAGMRAAVTAKYGDCWPFYKLLEPNGTESSLKAFKELQRAALSWKIAMGETTLNNYRGVQASEKYKNLASYLIPEEMRSQKSFTMFERVKKLQEKGYFLSVSTEGSEAIDIEKLTRQKS